MFLGSCISLFIVIHAPYVTLELFLNAYLLYGVHKADKKGEIVGFSLFNIWPMFYPSFNGFLFCLSLGHSLVLAHASCGPALNINCQSFHVFLSYIGC